MAALYRRQELQDDEWERIKDFFKTKQPKGIVDLEVNATHNTKWHYMDY